MKRAHIPESHSDGESEPESKVVDEESSPGSESDSPDEEEASGNQAANISKRVQSPPLKMAKLSKGELYKPPTNEELNQLKEAEDLFQSRLFRMQISELLNEVIVKESKSVTEFLHRLKSLLTGLGTGKVYDLTDQRWCRQMKIKVPLHQEPFLVKGKFSFHPPKKVIVFGSYVSGTCVKPDHHVDVAVEMPTECLQAKDHMNERFLRKRALYLCHIAGKLKGDEAIKDVKFTYHHGNHMKPVLVLHPAGKAGKLISVRLHATPGKDFFKMSKFHIGKNNIRQSWYTGADSEEQEDAVSSIPTPHYNTSILQDMTVNDNLTTIMGQLHEREELQHGVALLKVWLHQRELDVGYGGFSGFIMTMLVVYLISKRRLNRMMSSYQVLRNTLLELGKLNLDSEGISLCHTSNPNTPSIEEFHKHFGVVFIDSTGFVNLCANVTKNTFERVRQEAKLSVEYLDNPAVDGIECLLLTKVPFTMKFDHIFHLTHMEHLQSAVGKLHLQTELMDRSGDYIHTALPHVLNLVTQALGRRVTLLAPKLVTSKEWSVNSDPPLCNLVDKVTFGLLLDTAQSTSVLEKGPPADTPEAKAFQDFWGGKSELRRFQDGSICEAVVWPCKSMAKQRLVSSRIIKHILEKSADISSNSIRYVGGQLDSLLQPAQPKNKKFITYGTGEEQHISIMKVFSNLSKQIRQLKDLPLSVSSISGIDPVFRFAEVFPSVPMKQLKKDGNLALFWPDGSMKPWSQSMAVVVMMEGSGKWPDDPEAIRRIKAAFHIKLAEMLEENYKLKTKVAVDHVLVLKKGFMFEVRLAYNREVAIAKMVKTPEGMVKMIDTKESNQLEETNIRLPQLTSALHGLQQKHNSFSGAVRLAKRWIASQMLSGFLRDEAIELIVASLYTKPAPFTVPSCPQTGFLRFLNLLTQHDWRVTPVIVNMNEDLKPEEYREIKTNFTKQRSSLPLMFIATPNDKLKSVWTLKKPTAPILQRLVLLAQESLTVLQGQFMLDAGDMDCKLIFRPPLDTYDLLIHLDSSKITRRSQFVDPDQRLQYPQYLSEVDEGLPMPAVDFDPVVYYLRELTEVFGAVALFFHDEFGGDVIGVLWKPGTLDTKPFKVQSLNFHVPSSETSGKEEKLVANMEAIIEDMKVIGDGLVKCVQTRTIDGNWENVSEHDNLN